jgi:hypothetical protein
LASSTLIDIAAALRYFTIHGTDRRSHEEQSSMIRRYITWRNRHAQHVTPRERVHHASIG